VHARCARRRLRQASAKAATVLPHTLQSSTLPRPPGPGCAHWVSTTPGPGKVRESTAPPSVIVARARGWPAACTPDVHDPVPQRQASAKAATVLPLTLQSSTLPGAGPGVCTLGRRGRSRRKYCPTRRKRRPCPRLARCVHAWRGRRRKKKWAARCNRRPGPGKAPGEGPPGVHPRRGRSRRKHCPTRRKRRPCPRLARCVHAWRGRRRKKEWAARCNRPPHPGGRPGGGPGWARGWDRLAWARGGGMMGALGDVGTSGVGAGGTSGVGGVREHSGNVSYA